MIPIATKDLGIDSVTGLRKEVIVTGFNVNTFTENIIVEYFIVSYSPTNVSVVQEGPFKYYRYNDPLGRQAFTEWRQSEIGVAISAAINETIQKYPNLEQ